MGEKVSSTCYIFGGYTEEFSLEILKKIKEEDFIICADKGVLTAKRYGINPNLIIGDFDSYKGEIIYNCNVIRLPEEKDDTDLHYAAKKAAELGFEKVVLSGVTGGRLDMTLATIATLSLLDSKGVKATVLDSSQQIFITHTSLTIKRPDYNAHLSVFPMGDRAEGVSIKGAYYSVDNLTLTQDFPIGVSNFFLKDSVQISVNKGTVIVLLVKKD